jgi:hypothetical protein
VTPSYTTYQPNGPRCAPTCPQRDRSRRLAIDEADARSHD